MDYWKECIKEAFEDAEIVATAKQIDMVTSWVEGAHENYGLATGTECIPNPLEAENKRLAKALQDEKEKVFCDECGGKGYIVCNGGVRSSQSSCYKCNGEGRHTP